MGGGESQPIDVRSQGYIKVVIVNRLLTMYIPL
jgi:hypothetical protein